MEAPNPPMGCSAWGSGMNMDGKWGGKRGGDLLVQQVSRRIGHGSAEPLDGLFGLGFGNEYGWKLAGSAGCERNRRQRRHQRLLIVGGQPDADDLGACQRTARGPEAQRRES